MHTSYHSYFNGLDKLGSPLGGKISVQLEGGPLKFHICSGNYLSSYLLSLFLNKGLCSLITRII